MNENNFEKDLINLLEKYGLVLDAYPKIEIIDGGLERSLADPNLYRQRTDFQVLIQARGSNFSEWIRQSRK